MPIQHIELDEILSTASPKRRKLDELSASVVKAKRVVVVTGAGISCSSGIPDFRSEDGLYSLVKKRYPDTFVTGKDLFSAGTFTNPSTTSVFLTFIAELSQVCQAAQPTRTHHFIQKLERSGKLLRSYTQNVDGFERRMGMESGGRGKGLSKLKSKNVELHGDLGRVRCVLCYADYPATAEWMEEYREGTMPDCPACEERSEQRVKRGSRALAVGSLRPAIVLYDEPHPLGDAIGDLQSYDLKRGPDLLLIMGTSLKVHGLKNLVKSFAKRIHEHEDPKKRGLVVFVNATKPSKEWEGIIDVHVQGETDKWVAEVESKWFTQTKLDGHFSTQVGELSKAKPGPKKKGELADLIRPIDAADTSASKSSQPKLTSGQLPTPRASRSPSRGTSAWAGDSTLTELREVDIETPIRMAPYSTKPSDSFSSSPITPLTPISPPISPSKRGAALTPPSGESPSKRPKIPQTGTLASPGRGNLFALPANAPLLESADWEDIPANETEEVFGSPVKKAAPAKRGSRATKASAGNSKQKAGAVSGDKENKSVQATPGTVAKRQAAVRRLVDEATAKVVARRPLRAAAGR